MSSMIEHYCEQFFSVCCSWVPACCAVFGFVLATVLLVELQNMNIACRLKDDFFLPMVIDVWFVLSISATPKRCEARLGLRTYIPKNVSY